MPETLPKAVTHRRLRKWDLAYAHWLAVQFPRPRVKERLAKYQELSQLAISDRTLYRVEQCIEFERYIKGIEGEALEKAYKKFVIECPEAVRAHFWAIAQAEKAGDYKAVAALTNPVLDRVAPKNRENVQATQINITVSPHQLSGFNDYEAPTIEAEIVTPDE